MRALERTERRTLAALLAMLALTSGAWSFVEIADELREEDTITVERWVLRSVRDPTDPATLRGPDWLEKAARDITALGSAAILVLFTTITVLYFWIQRMRRHAALALAAVLGGVFLTSLLKLSFGRERPLVVPPLVEETSLGFPSGHSMMAAMVYLSLAVVLARSQSRLAAQAYSVAVGVVVAFLVGVTRVLLGVHYPTDVLAGWSVGLAWAAAWWLVLIWLERSRRRPKGIA